MNAVFQAWEAARANGMNNRAAAAEIGVSEAEMIASGCGKMVTRLSGGFAVMLHGLSALGEIKSVVRNAYAVQERTGRIMSVSTLPDGSMRLAADTFELDASVPVWCKAFSLTEPGKHGIKRSIQIFDGHGRSAAKFFLTRNSDLAAYEELTMRLRSPDQNASEAVIAIDTANVRRCPAAEPASLAEFLFAASRTDEPIEVTIGNDAARQRTTKVLERIKRSDRGGWINVLDSGLDLHLHEERIVQVWTENTGRHAILHWLADDGTEAFSARYDAALESLNQAALR